MASEQRLILVVDDLADLREGYAAVLEHFGYRVATAPDGRVGLAMTAELKPAAILLDMMMPEMDGLEFLERLPEKVAAPPPVIAMSGFDDFRQQAIARGARTFLRKPVEASELRATMDAILSGTPLDLGAREERTAEDRARASRRRDEFLARVDFNDPELQAALRASVRWCAGYFDVPIALVDLVRGDKVRVQAGVGDDDFQEGREVDQDRFYCSQVVEAAAPLLIGDAAASPVYASHPAAARGVRFYAGVPLRTADGISFGTLCVADRVPHILHGEDLTVLEALAERIAQRIAFAAGDGMHGPFAFVAPDVVTRDMLHVLVSASLQRIARNHGAIELAHLDLGADPPDVLQACTRAIYHATERAWLGLALVDRGVLAVIAGAGTAAAARERMRVILSAARKAIPGIRGIGVVTVASDCTRLVGPRSLESIADEARRSATERGGIRRVSVRTEASSDDVPPEPASAPY